MTKRESTRNRKYKQIQEHKIVQAELSLRWWHKHKCYQQFTPIVLQTNIPLHELEATENTMIQHHQAKLNFPYITSYMKGAFSGFTKAANNKHNGTALWAKLRQVRCTTRYGLFQTRLTVSHLCTNIASASTPFASFCNPPPPLPQYKHFTSSPTTFPRERSQTSAERFITHGVSEKTAPNTTNIKKPIYVQPLMRASLNNDLRQILRKPCRRSKTHYSTAAPTKHQTGVQITSATTADSSQLGHTAWQPNQEATCTYAQLQSAVSPDHIYNNHIAIQLAELQPQPSFLAYPGKSNI